MAVVTFVKYEDWALPKRKRMANTKKKTTKRTGTKKTTRKTAGRTAKATDFKVPRTAKQLATAIQARLKRSPGYWTELREAMDVGAGRIAQVMPRENGAAGATH